MRLGSGLRNRHIICLRGEARGERPPPEFVSVESSARDSWSGTAKSYLLTVLDGSRDTRLGLHDCAFALTTRSMGERSRHCYGINYTN